MTGDDLQETADLIAGDRRVLVTPIVLFLGMAVIVTNFLGNVNVTTPDRELLAVGPLAKKPARDCLFDADRCDAIRTAAPQQRTQATAFGTRMGRVAGQGWAKADGNQA